MQCRYYLQFSAEVCLHGCFSLSVKKKDLCYSIYSYNTSYKDTGLHVIYTALSKDTQHQAIRAILEQIKKITDEGISQDELDCAVEQAKSNLLMGLESTSTRMNRLARSQMCLGYVPEMDNIIAPI